MKRARPPCVVTTALASSQVARAEVERHPRRPTSHRTRRRGCRCRDRPARWRPHRRRSRRREHQNERDQDRCDASSLPPWHERIARTKRANAHLDGYTHHAPQARGFDARARWFRLMVHLDRIGPAEPDRAAPLLAVTARPSRARLTARRARGYVAPTHPIAALRARYGAVAGRSWHRIHRPSAATRCSAGWRVAAWARLPGGGCVLKRQVAISWCAAASPSTSRRAALQREAEVSARLNHPNVIVVY